MTSIRCLCGKIASSKHACRACASDEHLEHCHCDLNGVVPLARGHWRTCPDRHRHPYEVEMHIHEHE